MHKLIVAIIRHERLEKVLSVLKKERIGFTYS
jgi:nitrogen regulatory protein PII